MVNKLLSLAGINWFYITKINTINTLSTLFDLPAMRHSDTILKKANKCVNLNQEKELNVDFYIIRLDRRKGHSRSQNQCFRSLQCVRVFEVS